MTIKIHKFTHSIQWQEIGNHPKSLPRQANLGEAPTYLLLSIIDGIASIYMLKEIFYIIYDLI